MKTITAKEAAETSAFFEADWKFNGDMIVAVHGRDKSTEAKYAAAPEGSVMISTRPIRPGFVELGPQVNQMVSADAVFTA